MKKNFVYTLFIALASLAMASCSSDDASAGKSRITYYPTIEIVGDDPIIVAKGSAFNDPGCISFMNGEDVSKKVTVSGSVDTNTSGKYTLTYNSVKNPDGFGSSVTRDVLVLDPNSPYEGLYFCKANSYRVRQGAQVAYGADYPVLVLDNGDGTVDVDDLLGGWYCQRAGYGSDYAMYAVLAIAEDGTVNCLLSSVPGWGDSHDDYTGTFDAATGTFTMNTVYAGMDFVQTWEKYVNE